MLKAKRNSAAGVALVCAALAGGAHAAVSQGGSADYGAPVPAAGADRVVSLRADTKAINVTDGETVTFDANGKRFTWHVSTYPNVAAFDLSRIAAAGVRVYVAPNRLYSGGG